MTKLSGLFKIGSLFYRNPSSYQNVSYNSKRTKTYFVLPATPSCHKEILSLLWKKHIPYDPPLKGLGLGSSINPKYSKHILKQLNQDMSMMARTKEGNLLVGCCVNSVTTPVSPTETLESAKGIADRQLNQLMEFYAYLMAVPGLYRKYGANKIFEIKHVCVDPAHTGRGLEARLVSESVKFGHRYGFRVVRFDATSTSAAKICEDLNMRRVCEIPYDRYVDDDKIPIMNVEPPEISCQIFVHIKQ